MYFTVEIELIKNDVTEKGTISRVVRCKKCNHVYNISNLSYMHYLTRGAEFMSGTLLLKQSEIKELLSMKEVIESGNCKKTKGE